MFIGDIAGVMGEWLAEDMNENLVEAINTVKEAYKICVKELEKKKIHDSCDAVNKI